MNTFDEREEVRRRYAKIAVHSKSCCSSSCCSSAQPNLSEIVGYSKREMEQVPAGADLGLGCGAPVAFADINEGETVLDLGSGAGFDVFLAAKKVGPNGLVYGLDMTEEMIGKATENARKGGFGNVKFIKGFIEDIPLENESVDLVISNCVINLSPEKEKVFRETFRILRSRGRIVASDIVLKKPLPKILLENPDVYSSCVSGAMLKDDYISALETAGFQKIEILTERSFPFDLMANDLKGSSVEKWAKENPDKAKDTAESILSITFRAQKAL
ncbi:MAG: arsenite methyltransferase [Candidatus Eisenbacteria bacterium]|nr:arsenite methyltransferase [Candidatus Eisenbacteria bacterium]